RLRGRHSRAAGGRGARRLEAAEPGRGPAGAGRSSRDYASPVTPVSELTAYRDRFPILESTTYLINHSLGAMPAEAERRLEQFAREWKTRGARAWGEGWWNSVFTVGDLIGGILGAPPRPPVLAPKPTGA